MIEENTNDQELELKKKARVLKAKITNLKKKITSASGPTAGKEQANFEKSIKKNEEDLKAIEAQLSDVADDTVTAEDVLKMIDESNTLEETQEIRDSLPEEAPKEVLDALVAKEKIIKQVLKSNKVNPSSNSGLKKKICTPEEVAKLQADGLLYGFDPTTNEATYR